MTNHPIAYAQTAYRAYGETTDFTNYRGDPMPSWEDLGDRIQNAWIAAAEAVLHRARTPADGQLLITPGSDGQSVITRADPTVSLSFGLLIAAPDWLTMRDGLIAVTGVDPAGAPLEVVYRPVAAGVTDDLAACEGGWLTCERVS